jgi:hypothetical protein
MKERVRHKLRYGGDRHLKQYPMPKVDNPIQMVLETFKEEEK